MPLNEVPTKEQANTGVTAPARGRVAELERFSTALETGQMGVWSWDLRTQRIAWSTDLGGLVPVDLSQATVNPELGSLPAPRFVNGCRRRVAKSTRSNFVSNTSELRRRQEKRRGTPMDSTSKS